MRTLPSGTVRLHHSASVACALFLFFWSATATAGDRYWYDARGNWIEGHIIFLSEQEVDFRDRQKTDHTDLTARRSDADQKRFAAIRLLRRAASQFESSDFPAADQELAQVRKDLLKDGAPGEWANPVEATSEDSAEHREFLRGADGGERGSDWRWRWISLNGMQYEIDSVTFSNQVAGISKIVVRDHADHFRALNPADFPSIHLLPRWWHRATYVEAGLPAALDGQQWAGLRGPPLPESLGSTRDVIEYSAISGPMGSDAVWTQPSEVSAYGMLASAAGQTKNADWAVLPYDRRRHEITGDQYCRVGDFFDAVSEFQQALAIDETRQANHLRLALALIGTGADSKAIDELMKVDSHEPANSILRLAADECHARLKSVEALREQKDDFGALTLHNSAVEIAQHVLPVDYLDHAQTVLPPSVFDVLSQRRRLAKNVSLDNELTRVRWLDMTPRSARSLGGAAAAFQAGQLDEAYKQGDHAAKISLGEPNLFIPSREIMAMARSRAATQSSKAETAVAAHNEAIRIAAGLDPIFWESESSRDVSPSVRLIHKLSEHTLHNLWTTGTVPKWSLKRQLLLTALDDLATRAKTKYANSADEFKSIGGFQPKINQEAARYLPEFADFKSIEDFQPKNNANSTDPFEDAISSIRHEDKEHKLVGPLPACCRLIGALASASFSEASALEFWRQCNTEFGPPLLIAQPDVGRTDLSKSIQKKYRHLRQQLIALEKADSRYWLDHEQFLLHVRFAAAVVLDEADLSDCSQE